MSRRIAGLAPLLLLWNTGCEISPDPPPSPDSFPWVRDIDQARDEARATGRALLFFLYSTG